MSADADDNADDDDDESIVSSLRAGDTIIYSQMRFQLYQSHSLTVTGLKSGKRQNIGSLWAF